MRTHDSAERSLIGSGFYSQHLRVLMTNASGTWIELTNLQGIDWIDRVSIEESVDQPVASCVLTMKASHGALSLHPLRSDSILNRDDASAYAPLLFGGRRLRVQTGIGGPDGAAPLYGWHTVFYGVTEEPDATESGATISLSARDLGALLLDRIIEVVRSYGGDSENNRVPLEIVLQQILADNLTGSQLSFVIGLPTGAPPWALRKKDQERVPLLEALRTKAQQIAWDVRFRWNGDEPELQLYEPERDKVSPDFTLPPSEYLDLNQLKFGDKDVRNIFVLKYRDALAGDVLRESRDQDSASIAIYGPRYMEFSELDTTDIDTQVEADAMVAGAKSDLSTPFIDHVITCDDLWFMELGDKIAFPANDEHYDSEQQLCAVRISRAWQNGEGIATVSTRGKPMGAYADWIRKFGLGPGGFPLPAPYFGTPIGEETSGGGVLDDGSPSDGMVWMEIRFEKNTQYIDIYDEESETIPMIVPPVSGITFAGRLARPPGRFAVRGRTINFAGILRALRGTLIPPTAIPQAITLAPTTLPQSSDWSTFIGSATRALYYKRFRCIPYNWQNVPGPEFISGPVQAKDVAAITDGVVDAIARTVGNGQVTLDVDVGTTDPNFASFLFIMRNGIVLEPIYIGFQSGRRWTIIDAPLDTSQTYVYKAFIYTNGVTGRHVSTDPIVNDPGPAPPTPPATDTVVWIDPTPDMVVVGGIQHVRAQYSHNCAWATKVSLQKSPDGATPWADVVISQTTLTSGELLYNNVQDAWFRWRVSNADDSLEAFSTERFFTLVPPVGPPANTLRFINGSPRLNAAGDALLLDYQCTKALVDHVVLLRSTDGLTYTPVLSPNSSLPTGTFTYTADIDPAFFQLRSEDITDTPNGWSGVVYWPGAPLPPLDSPPIILPGYPSVVPLLGVPTVKILYASNISWFALMLLQSSANGIDNWVTVQTNPSAGDLFLYQTATPQFFRVTAQNSSGTQRLSSTPVYFPGLTPPGGGATDTSAPDITLAVQNDVNNVPRLVVSWVCANQQATSLQVQKSPDGLTGFAQVDESAAIAQGAWPFGDPLEVAYYRAQVFDINDLLLATSTVKYWGGNIFGAS